MHKSCKFSKILQRFMRYRVHKLYRDTHAGRQSEDIEPPAPERVGYKRHDVQLHTWPSILSNLRDPAVGRDSFINSLKTFLFATY